MCVRLEQGGDSGCDGWKGRVFSHAVKPVFGISIVGFTTMHYGMNKRSIGVMNVLGDGMGTVEVIVPQEDQGSEQLLFGNRDFFGDEESLELALELGFGFDAGARPRPKLRGFFGV